MIEQSLLNAIQSYSERMTRPVVFVLGVGEHNRRSDLVDFLTQIAGSTDKISLSDEFDANLSPMSFKIQTQSADAGVLDTGIVFSGIPAGHEFTSLILAVLQAGGSEIKLDDTIKAIIKNIKEPLHFQTFVSLSCHNCPDVVQSLNQFALLNDNICHEMIDGGVFPEWVSQKNIQGVPAVFLNGKPFASGKIDTAKLIEKLQANIADLMTGVAGDKLPTQDVAVLGGGPAGVAAAIYVARKGLKVTLVSDRIGGQVKDTQDIENLISVPLTNGSQLSANLAGHLKSYDITIKEMVSVTAIDENADLSYQITLNTGEQFTTRTVIIATGAKWRKLGIKGEEENIGNGVAFCPHCDGPFFKGKNVAVVGGGNSGVEAALDLAGIVNEVTLIEYGDKLRADQVLIDKVNERVNIQILTNAITQEITADNGKVNALIYQNSITGQSQTLKLSAVFVQIGLVPNSEVVGHLVKTTERGEIQIDERCQTSKQGIFACGDVTTVPFKQINIAMGEGAKAALSAFEYLVMQ